METFHHPRYEPIAPRAVYDGEREVARYFEETRTAFPDQRNELIALHHADDAVLMEAMLYGSHLDSFRGLPATGRSFEMRFLSMFPLTLRGRLATVANHPLTVGRALVRRVAGR